MLEKYESLIDGLISDNFGVVDDFIDDEMLAKLTEKILYFQEEDLLKQAGIGQSDFFQTNSEIRRDLIRWLPTQKVNVQTEQAFIVLIEEFIQYLNKTCFTSLISYEMHYALYQKGAFYKKHIDRFKSDSGRKFSIICYLNNEWKEGDGGELLLYLPNKTLKIEPIGKRCVFFKSDELEHEVLTSFKDRMSITGWLKDK